MPANEQEPPINPAAPTDRRRNAWFAPNRSGPGSHPTSWQGWLIIAVVVAAIITVVVLLRTGVL
jgi:hypothetical protein